MKKREPISKKTRFEVFKRDKFQCQYCGQTPPSITLEIDHINPIFKGGKNDINNLITSCFDCNRGKGKIELKEIPETLKKKMEIIKEKELQYSEYQKLLRRIEKRKSRDIENINKLYESYFPEYTLMEKFKRNSVKYFIDKIGLIEVEDALNIACSKIDNSEKAIKYFCGICWNKIKEKDKL